MLQKLLTFLMLIALALPVTAQQSGTDQIDYVESYVIEEMIKGLNASPVNRWDYYYYRTKNGVEVDLILEGKFGVLPIEIKSGSTTNFKMLKSLNYFIESQNLPLGIVINNDDKIKMLSEKIIQIPAKYI